MPLSPYLCPDLDRAILQVSDGVHDSGAHNQGKHSLCFIELNDGNGNLVLHGDKFLSECLQVA